MAIARESDKLHDLNAHTHTYTPPSCFQFLAGLRKHEKRVSPMPAD